MAINKNSLLLIGELLVEIRGIASDAIKQVHVSSLGSNKFTPESACQTIYTLADAAHNLPEILVKPAQIGFLLNSTIEKISTISHKIFGTRSHLVSLLPAMTEATMMELNDEELKNCLRELVYIQSDPECSQKYRTSAWRAMNAIAPELAALAVNDPKAAYKRLWGDLIKLS